MNRTDGTRAAGVETPARTAQIPAGVQVWHIELFAETAADYERIVREHDAERARLMVDRDDGEYLTEAASWQEGDIPYLLHPPAGGYDAAGQSDHEARP